MNSELSWQGMLFVSSPIFLYAVYCVLKLITWRAVGWGAVGLGVVAFLGFGLYGLADGLSTAHGTLVMIFIVLCVLVGRS